MDRTSKFKQTFNLNDSQQELLITKERASFESLCRRCGLEPKNLEKRIYKEIVQRDGEIIDGLVQEAKDNGFELDLKAFDPILRNKDYWQYLHWQTEYKRQMITDWICGVSKTLPINYDYVSKKAQVMGLSSVSKDNPDSLKRFLLNIPLVNIFDLEFNAFLAGDTVISEIPCVCIHTLLPEAAEFFTNLFLSVIIPQEYGDRIKLVGVDTLLKIVNSKEFVWSCLSGLIALLGATAEFGIVPKYQFKKTHPQLTYAFLTALTGSSGFVHLHEFGHLLMGHLEKPYTPSLEFEADAFAGRVLINIAENATLMQWSSLGIAIIFNLLDMIELSNPSKSKTHPEAIHRLITLEKEMGIRLYEFAFVIKQAWIPTYELFDNPDALSAFFDA